jgi:peptide/nickel transport system permease protein
MSLAQRALAHRSFVIGALLSLLLLLAAGLSLVWTPWSPYEIDMAAKLLSPDAHHWLGTDPFGRDVASLLLVGARNSILVGVIAVSIGLLAGTALGLLAAARRGWLERLIAPATSPSPSRRCCRPSCSPPSTGRGC